MRQCYRCRRRLRDGLFADDSTHMLCNACHLRRMNFSQHGRGVSSVNHTFIIEDVPIATEIPDPLAYIQAIKYTLADTLRRALAIRGPIKWYPAAIISFTRSHVDGQARIEARFNAPPSILLTEDDIAGQIDTAVDALTFRATSFADNGSDYVINNLEKLEIRSAVFNAVGGSAFVALPKFLANKWCIVNVKNDDDRCFEYAILAQLYPDKNGHRNRARPYKKHFGKLNFSGIDFPVKLSQIAKFEDLNSSISIGVQAIDESNRIVPLYASPHRDRQHVNLFYLTEFTREDGTVIHEANDEPFTVKNHY